jgi:hypothetical protein
MGVKPTLLCTTPCCREWQNQQLQPHHLDCGAMSIWHVYDCKFEIVHDQSWLHGMPSSWVEVLYSCERQAGRQADFQELVFSSKLHPAQIRFQLRMD